MPVIDRFEGETALLEGGRVPRSLLPMAAREGDVLREDGAGGYYVDLEETRLRKAALAARLEALFKRKSE
ncbi:MAG: DUF3006 domain-containing protein [Candidatus Pelethousia sp.]|nr:DUF3006 domain-containing protein [Candidatus Pelethousia sp.]